MSRNVRIASAIVGAMNRAIVEASGLTSDHMSALRVEMRTPFHERLALSRRLSGRDQSQMADDIGVSRATVSLWERGEREPSFSQVVRWAAYTGQSVEFLADAVTVEAPGVHGSEG